MWYTLLTYPPDMPRKCPSSWLLALLLAVFAPPLPASESSPLESVLLVAQADGYIGPNRAATIVKASTGWQVLGVRRESLAGRAVYRVKVLTKKGRVRMVRVDAVSGELLE